MMDLDPESQFEYNTRSKVDKNDLENRDCFQNINMVRVILDNFLGCFLTICGGSINEFSDFSNFNTYRGVSLCGHQKLKLKNMIF